MKLLAELDAELGAALGRTRLGSRSICAPVPLSSREGEEAQVGGARGMRYGSGLRQGICRGHRFPMEQDSR